MKRLLPIALVLALGGPLGAAGLFATRLPPGVPDGDALGWEKITGDVETETERVTYAFYVNPAREAIYELTRYRMTRFTLRFGHRTAETESEKLIWHAHPGTGQVPLCFALGKDGAWRALLPPTPEYRSEMGTTMQVYSLHRKTIEKR